MARAVWEQDDVSFRGVHGGVHHASKRDTRGTPDPLNQAKSAYLSGIRWAHLTPDSPALRPLLRPQGSTEGSVT